MNRAAGTGLIGGGIALIVVGAILDYAVTVTTRGFNIHTVGIILLAVGIGLFIVSGFVLTMGGRRRTSIQEDVRNVPGGQSRTLEERDDLAV